MKKVTVLRDCDGQLEIEVPERIMTEQEAEEIKQTWDAINSELCGGGYIVRIEEDTNMKTYNIYDMQTDELIGQVEAVDIIKAEYKACEVFDKGSNDIYALTEENSKVFFG